ncbi:MAG: zf-HC2 domain-containing protein [Acidobacteriota bacterium]
MTRDDGDRAVCGRTDAEIEAYLDDRMPPARRRRIRRHLDGCRACFERVILREPAHLFALLADQQPRADRWEGFWPALQERLVRAPQRPVTAGFLGRWLSGGRARWVLAGAATAAVLLFALVWLGPAASRRPAERLPSSVAQAPLAASRPMPETVERVRTADAGQVQVYSMTYYTQDSGAHPEIPPAKLVLIVDAGLQP